MISAAPIAYWRLSSFYLCYFALLGATAPYLAQYFDHLGLSSGRIGELVAIPMLMRCVAPNLWGWLADRSGRRLTIVRCGAACALLSFTLIFAGQSYAMLALVMALHAFFWHAVLPQFETIVLAQLRSEPARYSQIRVWGSIGFIVAVVLCGRLFGGFGLDIYPYAVVVILASIALASLAIPSTPASAVGGSLLVSGFMAQLRQPGVMAFYLCVALMQFSHGPYNTFLTLHLAALGYSNAAIGLLWALGVVAEVLMFMGMRRLLTRFSVRRVLAVSFALAAVRWCLLGGFADQLWILLLAQVLHAATFGSFHATAIHFVQRSFGARQQGQGQALYAALSGIGGALGALYAGYSWNTLGAGVTFAIASAAAVAATLVILLRMRE